MMNAMMLRCFDAWRQIGASWVTVLEPSFVQHWLQDRAALEHRTVTAANGAVVNQYKFRRISKE